MEPLRCKYINIVNIVKLKIDQLSSKLNLYHLISYIIGGVLC